MVNLYLPAAGRRICRPYRKLEAAHTYDAGSLPSRVALEQQLLSMASINTYFTHFFLSSNLASYSIATEHLINARLGFAR